MRRRVVCLLVAVVSFAISSALAGFLPNVALGKPVTLNPPEGFGLPLEDQPGLAGAASVTDGTFVGNGQNWRYPGGDWWSGTVSWYGTDNSIDVNLEGLFSISRFVVEADNNDWYLVQYHDTSGQWQPAWYVPPSCCWGSATRDSGQLDPITGDALRISGISWDYWYSVSELQAFGEPMSAPAPEPGSLLLLGTGLLAVARGLRRKPASAGPQT
jgi:hypothetical protein